MFVWLVHWWDVFLKSYSPESSLIQTIQQRQRSNIMICLSQVFIKQKIHQNSLKLWMDDNWFFVQVQSCLEFKKNALLGIYTRSYTDKSVIYHVSEWKQILAINQVEKSSLLHTPSVPLINTLLRKTKPIILPFLYEHLF